MKRALFYANCLCATGLFIACAKKPPAFPLVEVPPGADVSEIREPAPPPAQRPLVLRPRKAFTAFFAFDGAEQPLDLGPVRLAASAGRGKAVLVVGHACPLGTDEYNLALSRRRAEAVRRALVFGYGLDPALVTVDFRGEAEPITQNPDEYEKNRRAEISIKE